MADELKKIALSLEPQSETLAAIPLIKALAEHQVTDSLLEAKQLVIDLIDIAPQVVWVAVDQLNAFEEKMVDMIIETRVVSKAEAERISKENKPIRGTIDLHIRARGDSLNPEMIQTLKDQKLISGFRKGDNANDIYHWKDDRWYQDFYLVIFNKSDIVKIEKVLNEGGYIIVTKNK